MIAPEDDDVHESEAGDALADAERQAAGADLMTDVEARAEALDRERVLARRVVLACETVAALRSAQSPCEGEVVSEIDSRALGCTIRVWLRALDRLGREIGRWTPEPAEPMTPP